jgi:hypothetical protein
VSLGQLKVMSAIERCRTAALGGHVARCENAACGHTIIAYNSCRNRQSSMAIAATGTTSRTVYWHQIAIEPAAPAGAAFRDFVHCRFADAGRCCVWLRPRRPASANLHSKRLMQRSKQRGRVASTPRCLGTSGQIARTFSGAATIRSDAATADRHRRRARTRGRHADEQHRSGTMSIPRPRPPGRSNDPRRSGCGSTAGR